MKFRHSLRRRLIFAYGLFGAILSSVFAIGIYASLDHIDDTLVDNRLALEIEHFATHLQQESKLPAPTSPHIKAYIGTNSIPFENRKIVAKLPFGYHELYLDDIEYHVAVAQLPRIDESLFLLYNVSALEFTEKRKLQIGTLLFFGIIAVTALGTWIGFLTSCRIIAPLVLLAKQVSQSGPENLPTNLSRVYCDDEVGILARALEHAMERVERFVEREKQFTRDASHELRTPVTVIRGAVEVLRQRSNHGAGVAAKPLERIERSVANMENIIETFLWLAREEASAGSAPKCQVVPVIKGIIEQEQHLFDGKTVEIEVLADDEPVLSVPVALFEAVIRNLIHNAFHYTAKGKISIHICNEHITVSDTGIGIAACDLPTITEPHMRGNQSRGYGLGLAIVDRVCNRFGWGYNIESREGEGTIIKVVFQQRGTSALAPLCNPL
jgi:signal transduction histidine kinase